MPIVNDDGYHETELESFAVDWSKLNQPLGELKGTGKEDSPVVATTASPLVTIREGDIGEAINVGMGAGPASIEGKMSPQFLKNYVDSFVKKPEVKPTDWDAIIAENKVAKEKALSKFDAETPGTPEFNTKYGYEVPSKLEDMTPKQAADEYWKILTTKGDYSASNFDEAYSEAAKGTNAYAHFVEHKIKKYKDNPYEQIPFEAKPDTNVPKGWDYVDDFKQSHPIEPTLSPKEKFAKDTADTHNKLKAEMVELEAQFTALNQRAAEAGYTTPAFRGLTVHGGGEVNPVHNFGKSPGLYSSESPMLADMYSSYLSHHPGYKVPENTFGQGASVAPVYINTAEYHVADAEGQIWSAFNNKAIKEAKKKGAPGVVIKNVYDEPNSTTALGKPRTIYITFEEGAATVKSRFAERFDKTSKNMLKMIPAIATGGAAGYVSMQENERN